MQWNFKRSRIAMNESQGGRCKGQEQLRKLIHGTNRNCKEKVKREVSYFYTPISLMVPFLSILISPPFTSLLFAKPFSVSILASFSFFLYNHLSLSLLLTLQKLKYNLTQRFRVLVGDPTCYYAVQASEPFQMCTWFCEARG